MVQAAKSAKKKAQLPIIVLTEREILSELGPDCPQPIVDAIMESERPKKKLKEMKGALGKLSRAAAKGGWAVNEGGKHDPSAPYSKHPSSEVMDILKNQDIAELFVKHSSSFVEIAEAGAYQALESLADMEVWGLFGDNPAAFVKIAKAAGENAGWAFNAIGNPAIGKLFAENPNTVVKSFAEIAKAAQENAGWAFEAIGDRGVGWLFAENPQAFVAIARTTGKRVGYAFEALGDPGVGELFSGYPKGFLEIAKTEGENAYMKFNALCKPEAAGKFDDYREGKITLGELLESIKFTGY